jgi:CheY-like chemotaxis protein
MKDKIFDRFFQVEEHQKLNMGGAGLGLAISKNIINLMGGTIHVESKVGEGSNFYFDLPFREVPKHIADSVDSALIQNKNGYPYWPDKVILIAEDDEINFVYLREILSKTGVTILHARTGLKAIDIAETHEKIDLILMDIKMPEVDGIEATKYISTIKPQIPIVAQTAYALYGDQAKCINAGCCAYITKPVEMGKLLQVVGKYVSTGNFINHDYLIKRDQ